MGDQTVQPGEFVCKLFSVDRITIGKIDRGYVDVSNNSFHIASLFITGITRKTSLFYFDRVFRHNRQAYARIPFHEAQLNHEVAIQSRRLTLTHQDPVDRFLGATAQVYDLTLVTADVQLLQSPGFATLSNL